MTWYQILCTLLCAIYTCWLMPTLWKKEEVLLIRGAVVWAITIVATIVSFVGFK